MSDLRTITRQYLDGQLSWEEYRAMEKQLTDIPIAPAPVEAATVADELERLARDINTISGWIAGPNRDDAFTGIENRLRALAARLRAGETTQT